MNEEKELKGLVKDALKGRDRMVRRNIIFVVLAALAIILTVWAAYYKMKYEDTLAEMKRLATYQETVEKATGQARALEAEVARLGELLLYSDKLRVQGLKVRQVDGELVIAGEVKNYGRRAVNDIELTAYFLGEDGTPLHEQRYVAKSHDGRPLYRGQRRRFKFTVNPAPEKATDLSLIITRIEF